MNRMKTRLALMFVSLMFSGFPIASHAVPGGQSITWPGNGQGRVVFEGKEHAEKGYGCKDCHPALFQMKKGSEKITMAALDKGQFCGACHNGKTAFATNDPRKCHECHKDKEKKHKEHSHKHDHD